MANVRGNPTTTKTTAEPAFPPGVRLITITLPVFVGDVQGYEGGRHVDTQISLDAAKALNRIRVAQEEIIEAAMGEHASHIAKKRPEVGRGDVLRTITDKIAAAVAAQKK